MKIPFQVNVGGIVAILPRGEVEFLDHRARPLIEAVNSGRIPARSDDFKPFVITDPLVDLDRFHLTAPAFVFVEVTNLCNLRCKHCYVSSGLRRPNELATEEILRLLDELADMGVLHVFLTGGELFAHRDAVQIVQHARSKPFHVQIFTNALLITEEKLAQLPPGTSFNISFDTADPERTVRGGMDFPKLRRCFEWMKKYDHVFRTAISVHHNNVADALEIYEWCAANGYPRPQWQETHPLGRALLHPDILLQPEQIDAVFEVYKRCMDRYTAPPDEVSVPAGAEDDVHYVDTIKFVIRLEQATRQEKCARSIAYINAAGDVYPCSNCQSALMFQGGNVRERSFRDIWEHDFEEFRRITFEDFTVCRTCPVEQAEAICQFRCPPLSMNLTKEPLGCGATEYLRRFVLRTHHYWQERQRAGLKVSLTVPRR